MEDSVNFALSKVHLRCRIAAHESEKQLGLLHRLNIQIGRGSDTFRYKLRRTKPRKPLPMPLRRHDDLPGLSPSLP